MRFAGLVLREKINLLSLIRALCDVTMSAVDAVQSQYSSASLPKPTPQSGYSVPLGSRMEKNVTWKSVSSVLFSFIYIYIFFSFILLFIASEFLY